MATTIRLIRHGETDWNRDHRWQGHADPPLNDEGRRQSRELADQLALEAADALYSSDLERARETAEIVAARLSLPIRLDPRLREVDVGEWSGLTMKEVEERYPEGARRRAEGGTGWTDGEPREAMERRVLEVLNEIAAAHPGQTVLVVTHGGALRAVWSACGEPRDPSPRFGNCSVEAISIDASGMRRVGGYTA